MYKSLLQFLSLIAIAFAPVAASGQTAATPVQASEAAASSSAPYILGPDDEIEVSVFGQQDLHLKSRISADGTIVAPLLGRLNAAGMTTSQFGEILGRGYEQGGYLVKPSITVQVTTYASKTVTVLGQVSDAGLIPIDRPYSAAAIIAKAGGVAPGGANAVILTKAGSTESQRLSLITSPGAANYMVQPGDTLFVPPAEMVYVYGQVNDPGAFPYVPGMTYRQALARAGGPTLAGSTRKYEVKRGDVSMKPKLDEQIKAEDVLIIKEKLF